MLKFPAALLDCQAIAFEKALKRELEGLPAGSLPLHRATTRGGYVDDRDISATVLQVQREGRHVQCKIGVFFTEIVVGCGCGDDPFPENAYCELMLRIDNTTGEADIEIIS